MNKNKISIIIPVYNVEKYLKRCIDSVINQTYKDIEVILIDDGSTDDSAQICDDYCKKDNRIQVIHKENGGLSSARNVGIEKSTGKYIMFLDSDDWLELETCDIVYKTAQNYNADIIMWPYVREINGKSKKKVIFKEECIVFDKTTAKKQLHRRMIGLLGEELATPQNADAIVTACVKLYKSNIIKDNKINFVDTKLIGTEDALFNLYVFGHVKKVIYINKYFYHYRRDNIVSLTTKYKQELYKQWSNLFNIMSNYIVDNNLDNSYTQALNNRISLSIIGLGLNELSNSESHLKKIKKIKNIINDKAYRKASKTLTLKYFPFYWKVFFLFVKMSFATPVYILLLIMNKIRGK